MGCLFSRSVDEEVEINLSGVANAAVMCKTGAKGKDVQVLENNGFAVSGKGIFLGSCPLDCDTGRWEITINKDALSVEVGVMRFKKGCNADLSKSLSDYQGNDIAPAWILDSKLYKEGDVVGVYWDQTDIPMVSFTVNGKLIADAAVMRIRPSTDVYAAVSVRNRGEALVSFDESGFKHPPISSKFKMIICSTSLI